MAVTQQTQNAASPRGQGGQQNQQAAPENAHGLAVAPLDITQTQMPSDPMLNTQ